jgi:hypothetical protein
LQVQTDKSSIPSGNDSNPLDLAIANFAQGRRASSDVIGQFLVGEFPEDSIGLDING